MSWKRSQFPNLWKMRALVASLTISTSAIASDLTLEAADTAHLAPAKIMAQDIAIYQHRRSGAAQLELQRPQTKSASDFEDYEKMSSSTALARSKVAKLIAVAEIEHGLPRGLLDALIWTESTYRPNVISRAGAVGLTQLMPGTAEELSIADSFHVPSNINGGAKYLKTMFDEFRSIPLALAAYNAGPGNVRKYNRIPPFQETQAYVQRVMRRWTQTAQIKTTLVGK